MPLLTQRTAIGGALTFEAEDRRGVERLALRAITPFARARVAAFVLGRFFHGI